VGLSQSAMATSSRGCLSATNNAQGISGVEKALNSLMIVRVGKHLGSAVGIFIHLMLWYRGSGIKDIFRHTTMLLA
jgi:hypothetical protein